MKPYAFDRVLNSLSSFGFLAKDKTELCNAIEDASYDIRVPSDLDE